MFTPRLILKMDKKKLVNDLILIGSLLILAIVSLVVVLTRKSDPPSLARVYVQDVLVESIDLNTEEDQQYVIQGVKGELTLEVHVHSIRVLESNCPHQDCVHQGYVKDPNHPIICAYNQVFIILEGSSDYDVEI